MYGIPVVQAAALHNIHIPPVGWFAVVVGCLVFGCIMAGVFSGGGE